MDAGSGLGLLSFNILKKHKNVKIIPIDNDNLCLEKLNKLAETHSNLKPINCNLENIKLESDSVNKILSRSSIMHCKDKAAVLKEFYRILKSNSQISLFELIFYDKLDRYYEYLSFKTKNYYFYKAIEEKVRNDTDDPLTNCDLNEWRKILIEAGFKNINIIQCPMLEYFKFSKQLSEANIFYDGYPHTVSLKEKFLKYMTEEQFNEYYQALEENTKCKTLKHKVIYLYIFAQKEPNLFDYIKLKVEVIIFILCKILPFNLKNKISSQFSKLKCNIS